VIENPQIHSPEHRLHVRKILAGEGEARPFYGEVRQQRVGGQRPQEKREEKIVQLLPLIVEIKAGNAQRHHGVEDQVRQFQDSGKQQPEVLRRLSHAPIREQCPIPRDQRTLEFSVGCRRRNPIDAPVRHH
jgi:hypothetical protein